MLGHRVGGVGDQLAEKDVLLGVEPLLDDGEDVSGLNRNAARAAGVFLIHDGVLLGMLDAAIIVFDFETNLKWG
jgi:hypothetical protein